MQLPLPLQLLRVRQMLVSGHVCCSGQQVHLWEGEHQAAALLPAAAVAAVAAGPCC